MDLDCQSGFDLIIKAMNENQKDYAYKQYCAMLPMMLFSKENIEDFETWYAKATKPQKKVSKEEAYTNAENILAMISH